MIAVETDAGQLAAGRRDSPHTVWDQTTKQRSDTVMAFPTPLQATREASSGIYDMNVFGEDPLRLIAFGNKEFAGKNADLDQLD